MTDYVVEALVRPTALLAVLTFSSVLLTACASAGDPYGGLSVEDFEKLTEEEVERLDCSLDYAGHFYIRIPQGALLDINRRIEALGYDHTSEVQYIRRSERGANGVLRDIVEAVEGEGWRYRDALCRYKRIGR